MVNLPSTLNRGGNRKKKREEKGRMVKKLERLIFALNGERYEVSAVDPSLTLLEFIRTQTRFKSPKLGCGEGTSVYMCDMLS